MTTPRTAPPCRRYRRVAVTYMVVREPMDRAWPAISSPEAAADLARELLREHDDDKEHVWVIFLNAQNAYIGHHLVSIGTLSQSIVHSREVLGPALREGAAHLLVLHNHPSGDPTPSRDDLALTRQLAEGARLLGLTLHDHLIGASRSMWGECYIRNPVRSAQVATRAGERTRSRISSEASRTMWSRRARPLHGLLARALRWLRKKPLSEAPMVEPPANGRARVESSDLRLDQTKEFR